MTTSIHPADVRVIPDWELCDRLRRSMRLVRGLDNIDIAEFLGCQPATVSTWLNGRRSPNKPTVMMWADMTGVDRDWLWTGVVRHEGLEPPTRCFGGWPRLTLVPTVNRQLTVDRRVA